MICRLVRGRATSRASDLTRDRGPALALPPVLPPVLAPALPPVLAPVLALALVVSATPAHAQVSLDRPLRVSLDCSNFFCDRDFFLEEIPWVTFVRDRQDADVHILATRQTTGAGGGAYAVEFRGRGAFDQHRLTLQETTDADATPAVIRSTLVAVLKLGLAPFAASTPTPPRVEVLPPVRHVDEPTVEPHDPWNRWSFRVGVNGFLNGESRQQFVNSSGNVQAGRVTDDWKIRVTGRGSFSRSDFQLDETTTFTSRQESYAASGLVVRSVGAQWGVGGISSWTRSTFSNYDASVRLAPAIEYNVFPYDESTRRLLTILYAIGPRYNDYRTITIFGETSETVLEQQLITSYNVTQPWGTIDTALRLTHYVAKFGDGDDWPSAQYNAQLFGGFNLRLVRGLTANVFGNIDMVRGQIQLAAAGLSQEEILTRQRELATNYRYFLSVGLGYRFGSIFSDVVNRRFDAIQ